MTTENYIKFGKRLVTEEEYLAPGHRACIGCGEVLAVRLACKALGPNSIVVSATGCMEIVSSQLPWTSWRVPWIHTILRTLPPWLQGLKPG